MICIAFDCDAYGQMTLPNGGTYDVLRLILDNIVTNKGSVYYNNAWHIMPDFVASLMGGSAIDTFIETNYQWWTNDTGVKFMLAELNPAKPAAAIYQTIVHYCSPQLALN